IDVDVQRTLPEPPEDGRIVLVPTAASGGFTIDDLLVFVTDAEIFGFRKQRRPIRQRKGIRSNLLATLEVWDYIVHADHGIARFGGLVRRSMEGGEREYLELQ